MVASHPCSLLHFRAIRQLCNACWMPALTKRRRRILPQIKVVRQLNAGADKEKATDDGFTPLHRSTAIRHLCSDLFARAIAGVLPAV